jgi:hypothetical protein
MMMDYHQMTIDEPRDSPARKLQFRVTCVIMIVGFLFMTIPAGILSSIKINEGTFPGGTFVYKSTKRDYVASGGLELYVGENLMMNPKDFEDRIYTVYLDDLTKVKYGRAQRFASGFLSNNSKSDRKMEESLTSVNSSIEPLNRLELKTLPAEDLWPRIRYKKASLPKVKAAIVNFPSTHGFVSSLMFQFFISPALRRYATEKQLTGGRKKKASVAIITTCSIKNQMCTHYAPIEKAEPFLLGQLNSDEYAKTLPIEKKLDFQSVYDFVTGLITGKSQEL